MTHAEDAGDFIEEGRPGREQEGEESQENWSAVWQPMLLTLDKGYLLTAAFPDLQRGIAPLGPPVTAQPLRGVGPPSRRPWPQA